MKSFQDRFSELANDYAKNASGLADDLGVSRQTISAWKMGTRSPKRPVIEHIAQFFNVNIPWLMGLDVPRTTFLDRETEIPSNLVPRRDLPTVPVVGDIACGTPITAEENIDGYISVAPGLVCDFALLCKGDSMAPTFRDGDYVLVRQQEDVNDGQIAAVLIDGEATLKRIHHIPGGVILIPDNQAAYQAITYMGDAAAAIRIMGKAVGYQREI